MDMICPITDTICPPIRLKAALDVSPLRATGRIYYQSVWNVHITETSIFVGEKKWFFVKTVVMNRIEEKSVLVAKEWFVIHADIF